MTNKQELREAAEKAFGAYDRLSIMPADDIFDISQHEGTQLDADITALNAFNESANPATVLALLDELEAAEKRIAELQAREVTLPKKNIGWDRDGDDCWNNAIEECSKAIISAGIRINGEG